MIVYIIMHGMMMMMMMMMMMVVVVNPVKYRIVLKLNEHEILIPV
jgi:hypothetical protein